MSDKFKPQGTELFEQAIKNYDHAFQAALKAQEDAVTLLMDCAGKFQAPKDLQKRFTTSIGESLPIVQKRIEESLHLVEQSSRTTIELLKQAFDTAKVDSGAAAQSKVQDLWEASLQTVRTNAQALTQLNAKAVESWVQCAQKCFEMPTTKGKAA
jgi:hypothetical protein